MKLVFVIGGKYQGKTYFAMKKFPAAVCIDDYQQMVLQQLTDGQDPIQKAEVLLSRLRQEEGTVVVISEEMGCGVVPMEKSAREYREANGRVCCLIAAEADEVYRIIAGLAERMK